MYTAFTKAKLLSFQQGQKQKFSKVDNPERYWTNKGNFYWMFFERISFRDISFETYV